MSLQHLIDGIIKQQQKDRASTQMTLGQFIDRLSQLPSDSEVVAFESPHSFRGYYCDLAFEPIGGKMTVSKALEFARSAMGEIFEGYKGGEYQMGRNTPIWLAFEGSSNNAQQILAVNDDGTFSTKLAE